MSIEDKLPEPPPSQKKKKRRKKENWFRIAARKIGEIQTLVGAVVMLIVVVLGGWYQIRRASEGTAVVTPPKCVRISNVWWPREVAYTDWHDARMSVSGRNDCNQELGLYLTFGARRDTEPPRFSLRQPYEDSPECTGAAAQGLPKCWDAQKPIPISAGAWRWEAPLPPLKKIGEPRSTEVLGFTWAVRDYDAPDDNPLATAVHTMRIHRQPAPQAGAAPGSAD